MSTLATVWHSLTSVKGVIGQGVDPVVLQHQSEHLQTARSHTESLAVREGRILWGVCAFVCVQQDILNNVLQVQQNAKVAACAGWLGCGTETFSERRMVMLRLRARNKSKLDFAILTWWYPDCCLECGEPAGKSIIARNPVRYRHKTNISPLELCFSVKSTEIADITPLTSVTGYCPALLSLSSSSALRPRSCE